MIYSTFSQWLYNNVHVQVYMSNVHVAYTSVNMRVVIASKSILVQNYSDLLSFST